MVIHSLSLSYLVLLYHGDDVKMDKQILILLTMHDDTINTTCDGDADIVLELLAATIFTATRLLHVDNPESWVSEWKSVYIYLLSCMSYFSKCHVIIAHTALHYTFPYFLSWYADKVFGCSEFVSQLFSLEVATQIFCEKFQMKGIFAAALFPGQAGQLLFVLSPNNITINIINSVVSISNKAQ